MTAMQAFIISVIFNAERPSKLAFQLQRKHECGKFIFRRSTYISKWIFEIYTYVFSK